MGPPGVCGAAAGPNQRSGPGREVPMKPAWVMVVAMAVAVAAMVAGGCGMPVRTPLPAQRTQQLPASLPLAEAKAQYEVWLQQVRQTGAQWQGEIERVAEIENLLGQLTLSALNEFGPSVAGVPVLGPVMPLITGIVGLMVGGRRLHEEKEASFNKGLETGRRMAGPGSTT